MGHREGLVMLANVLNMIKDIVEVEICQTDCILGTYSRQLHNLRGWLGMIRCGFLSFAYC